jgi:hypothetical protein
MFCFLPPALAPVVNALADLGIVQRVLSRSSSKLVGNRKSPRSRAGLAAPGSLWGRTVVAGKSVNVELAA